MTRNLAMPVPPRLSMEEYADFVGENWKDGDTEKMERQKCIEKRIVEPFRIPSASVVCPPPTKMKNIHAVYARLFRIWREKRMIWFARLVRPQAADTLLDVGGYPSTWTPRPPLVGRIECVNVHAVPWDPSSAPAHAITVAVGDGCALAYADKSFDIVFSNSVIEHVGDWHRQCAFAAECRRVGSRLWIQTPAFECPVEPHYLGVGLHWLPIPIRRRVIRWCTLWGWIARPSQNQVDRSIAETRLLKRREMEQLFPDCAILTERMLGFIPKSYVACRTDEHGNAKCSDT